MNHEPNCCELCAASHPAIQAGKWRCINPSCDCHQPPASNPPTKEGWESELELMLGLAPEGTLKYDRQEQLKKFIRTIIAQARSEVSEIVENARPNEDGKGLSVFRDPQSPFVYRKGTHRGDTERKTFAMGYLQAKKDIRAKLDAARNDTSV